MDQQDQQDSDPLKRVRQLFKKAAFVADVGINLSDLGPGWAETSLSIAPRHTQTEQFVHAGVQATMADHTAGAAAATLVQVGEAVVTVEYKINFLKPAVGDRLRCRAEVLRAGKTVSVVEAKVYTGADDKKPVAAAMLTMTIFPSV